MPYRPLRDAELIQITDAAFADAARKAGEWLKCRPGCTQCCTGAFSINALDAARLKSGLSALDRTDPPRARQLRERARAYIQRISDEFPGDLESGVLDDSEQGSKRFEQFANDEVCPALDPKTGTCDLYASRPMTCRVFGPPVRDENGSLGVCELCFHGASPEQIAACEMVPDPQGLEAELLKEFTAGETAGNTIVAFVLGA
jgi:Fe-S-cluster containining protein